MVPESITQEDQRLIRQREYNRAYREANREKLRAQAAARRAADPEALRRRLAKFKEKNPGIDRMYSAAYRARHPEKRKATVAKYGAANTERRRAYFAEYAKANSAKLAAKSAYRRAVKKQATPAWASPTAIANVYVLAREMSEKSGLCHHVDHIVPLQSKLVCGLHCEANLQIITRSDNAKKHNSFWPDKP